MERREKTRLITFTVFAVAIALLVLNSLATTNLLILDTDPSTYIVVPMLMLIVFPFFMMRKQFEAKLTNTDVAIGAAGLAVYILLTAYIRFLFPVEALGFKTDMLLLPLAVASLVSMLFGINEIKRFKVMIIYSLFASPAILYPLFSLNLNFASLNTQAVYLMLSILIRNISYTAPTYISANGISISIGEACAGIGALIGLVMLMLPVAYLYEGKLKNKFYWVASGFVLILVLNILRMFSIGVIWAYFGLASAASFVHEFAGIFIFYLSIILMILLLGKYGLTFPKQKRRKPSSKRPYHSIRYAALLLALLLAGVYFGLTINYPGYAQVSPISFGYVKPLNLSSTGFRSILLSIISDSNSYGYLQSLVPVNNASIAIVERNATLNQTPIVVFITSTRGYVGELLSNNTLLGSQLYLDRYGYEVHAYALASNGTTFFVTQTSVPVQSSIDSLTLADVYVIIPGSAVPPGLKCGDDPANTWLYNVFTWDMTSRYQSQLESAYCISERFIKPSGNNQSST